MLWIVLNYLLSLCSKDKESPNEEKPHMESGDYLDVQRALLLRDMADALEKTLDVGLLPDVSQPDVIEILSLMVLAADPDAKDASKDSERQLATIKLVEKISDAKVIQSMCTMLAKGAISVGVTPDGELTFRQGIRFEEYAKELGL